MKEFITFYLLFWWVMSILYKDNWIQGELESLGNRFKKDSYLSKFVLGVGRCNFCLENHIGTIGAIGYYSYCLDYRVLVWGVFCASITSWSRCFLT